MANNVHGVMELESSTESDVDIATSDDETHLALSRLRFQGESDEEKHSKQNKSWFSRKTKTSYQPLSVQSGDIIRPSQNTDKSIEEPESTGTYSRAKKLASIVFNFILKIVFFHKRIPIVSTSLLILNVVFCVVLVWAAIKVYPPDINISLRSFTIPTHPSQKHWDSLLAARAHRYLNATSTFSTDTSTRVKRDIDRIFRREVVNECIPNPSVSYQTYPMYRYTTWNLELVYRVPDPVQDKNLLTKERLGQIHKIEEEIYSSSGYAKVCHKTNRNAPCDRLTSVVTSLYPTNSDGSNVYNTSDGFTPDLNASLHQFKNNKEQALWFTGGLVTIVKNTDQIKARLLRSQLRVGLPLPCFDGLTRISEQKDRVYRYFESLIPFFDGASTSEVEVLYGGTALFDYQVDSAKIHDSLLAVPSFLLIIIVVFVLTGFSAWLTIAGIYSIFSCFPWAFFVYRIVLDIESVGILNIISLFVVIGIGVDDVFVFINTFKQTTRLKNLSTIHERLGYTILVAGKATFFTSLTTSLAFFANAVSSIPAVKQFGLFMGLVVIFCYIQVLIVLPLSLHIWHCVFRYCERCCYYPCSLLCRRKPDLADSTPVRMSELANEDDDSGIGIADIRNGNEIDSNSLDSIEIETNELIPKSTSPIPIHDTPIPNQSNLVPTHNNSPMVPRTRSLLSHNLDNSKDSTAMDTLSTLLQVLMLKYIARPLMFFHTWRSDSQNASRLARVFLRLTLVAVYIVSLVVASFSVGFNLRLTDHPPQLFNPDTNLQKMLDLTGNLSENGLLSCPNGCGGGPLPYIPPPSTGGGGSNPPTNPPHTTPSHTTPSSATQKTTTEPPTVPKTDPPSTHSSHDTDPPSTHSSHDTDPPSTHPSHNTDPPSTHSRPNTDPPSTHSPLTTHSPPKTDPSTNSGSHTTSNPHTEPPSSGGGGEIDIGSSRLTNNVIINVVFGIKDVVRRDNSSHVLPEGTEGDYALQEDSFYGNFTCNYKPHKIDLTGTIRALCRICANISNPVNGLILDGNFNCFPSSLASSAFRCLYYTAVAIPECLPVVRPADNHNVSVVAGADVFYNQTDGGSQSLRYLSMAFRSRSSPNDSPFNSIKDYQKWEDFLSDEITAINKVSGPGDLYEGADQILSSGFQTSEWWYQVNLEIIAVYGSLYGICVSALLCILIIVFLTHNWRIVLAILFTILNIIVTLLGFFVAFGWSIGIVEAITLSIVVGNSLDYCIHLCEGYMSADSRHIAFVEQYKFMSGASIRVKRVAASISFVGVSIISSAITTILATIPMLATKIELFTRFGQILLLDTVLAISYTLVFCSTFLALFGPTDSKFSKWKVINAVLTIFSTFAVCGGLFLFLYVLSASGVPILTPDGSPLFG